MAEHLTPLPGREGSTSSAASFQNKLMASFVVESFPIALKSFHRSATRPDGGYIGKTTSGVTEHELRSHQRQDMALRKRLTQWRPLYRDLCLVSCEGQKLYEASVPHTPERLS